MFHTFTSRQRLSIIIYHLQFCPTQPRGFTRSTSRTRVTTSAQFLAPTQSTGGGGARGLQGDGITSQKTICIDGHIPTQASTSPHSVERRLLNKLEICLTHHVSTEELLERADMKAISKLKRGEAAQMEDDWTVY